MSNKECRDWIALQNPIYRVTRGGAIGPSNNPEDLWEEKLNQDDEWWPVTGEEGWPEHPIPDTIDAASAAMPKGWFVTCTSQYWKAVQYGNLTVEVARTPDEKHDRFRLAIKAKYCMHEEKL